MRVKFPSANAKASLVGLLPGTAFNLYQPQNDTLGLHEWLGLNLSRSSGMYASQQQFVEVGATRTHTLVHIPYTIYPRLKTLEI